MVKSKAQKLRAKLAQILNTEETKIDIFSVMLKQTRPPITDIRFSAHGSPYYKPVRLNGMVLQHREEVKVKHYFHSCDLLFAFGFHFHFSCIVNSVPILITWRRNRIILMWIRIETFHIIPTED